MFFKNSNNLDVKKEKAIKKLIKEDSNLNEKNLNGLINFIAIYHTNQFKRIPEKLYHNQNKDLIDVSTESNDLLLQIFNMNELYKVLNENSNYEKQKFEYDDNFRRKIMNVALYEIISLNGKEKGSEYGLIFAKMFNFSLELPMQYASYDGMYDERFIKYVDTYLGLGGSTTLYWLPNYFDNIEKNKYDMEDLNEIVYKLKNYLNKNKVNSIN